MPQETTNQIINLIKTPIPSLITAFDQINRQVNFATANIYSEQQLGSVTGTKRHSSTKLFAMGVIPPDVPINYIPIKKRYLSSSLAGTVSDTVGGASPAGEGVAAPQRADGLELRERTDAEIKSTNAIMLYSGATRLESSDPNYVQLNKNVRAASAERQKIAEAQTSVIRQQIQILQGLPPLAFLVNPREFTKNYEQAVDSGTKGRFGHIVHSWLERPLKISSSGVSAAQYVMDAFGGGGLSTERRVHSISYHNLMSALMLYKNNGVLFSGNEVGWERGIPLIAFSLYIYFDNHIYIGSFDDFEISDKADKPYNMEYSFRFNVRYDLDIDSSQLVEARIFDFERF